MTASDTGTSGGANPGDAVELADLAARISAAGDWTEAGAPIVAARQALAALEPAAAAGVAARRLLDAIAEAALRLFQAAPANGRWTFSFAALALAPMFAAHRFAPPARGAWSALAATLQQALRQQSDQGRAPAMAELLRLMAVDGVARGTDDALADLITQVADTALDARLKQVNMSPADLGATLAALGWFEAGSDAVGAALDAALTRAAATGPAAYAGVGLGLARLLNYARERSMAWLEFLSQRLLIPQIAAAGRDPALADHALMVERLVYGTVLKKEESAAVFKRTYAAMGPALAAAGAAYGRARFAAARTLPLPEPDTPPPRVAFFIQGDFATGHAETLYMFLRGLAQLTPRPITPLVYVWDGPGKNLDTLARAVAGLDVAIRRPEPPRGGGTAAVDWLRAQAADDRVAAVVFVSVTWAMCFAAAVPVAPVQVWWSMKYHGLYVPELQGYLGNAMFQHRPAEFGPHWRVGDVAMPFLADDSLRAAAAEIRAKFDPAGDTVVLGALARAEKLLNPAYARMLGRLMRAHPRTVYLWTGRFAPPEFVAMLEAEGIAPRCHFIGWVNVKLYAHVLDVMLDSFPLSSGITGVETMAAGKPVVTLLTPESLETSIATSFVPLYQRRIGRAEDQDRLHAIFTDVDGAAMAPFVETVEAYERLAGRLIADHAFRRRLGAACRAFVETFFRDERRMAGTTAEQILAMIAERRAGAGGVTAP